MRLTIASLQRVVKVISRSSSSPRRSPRTAAWSCSGAICTGSTWARACSRWRTSFPLSGRIPPRMPGRRSDWSASSSKRSSSRRSTHGYSSCSFTGRRPTHSAARPPQSHGAAPPLHRPCGGRRRPRSRPSRAGRADRAPPQSPRLPHGGREYVDPTARRQSPPRPRHSRLYAGRRRHRIDHRASGGSTRREPDDRAQAHRVRPAPRDPTRSLRAVGHSARRSDHRRGPTRGPSRQGRTTTSTNFVRHTAAPNKSAHIAR
jgi:hypothetical protein